MIRNTNKNSYFKTSKCGKLIKIDNLAIFSIGIKNKLGADTEKDFSITKNIEGVKLRARATGELMSDKLNLDATLKKATALAGDSSSDKDSPSTPSGGGTSQGGGSTPSQGGGSTPSQGGGSTPSQGGGTSQGGDTPSTGGDNPSTGGDNPEGNDGE